MITCFLPRNKELYNRIADNFLLLRVVLFSILLAAVQAADHQKPFFGLSKSTYTPRQNSKEKTWILKLDFPTKWSLDIELEPEDYSKSYLFSIRERKGILTYALTWDYESGETILHVDDVLVVFNKAPRKFVLAFDGNQPLLYYDCTEAVSGIIKNGPLKVPTPNNVHLRVGGYRNRGGFSGKMLIFSFYEGYEIAFTLSKDHFCQKQSNRNHRSFERFAAGLYQALETAEFNGDAPAVNFKSNSIIPKVQLNCSNTDEFINRYDLVEKMYNCARLYYANDIEIANEIYTCNETTKDECSNPYDPFEPKNLRLKIEPANYLQESSPQSLPNRNATISVVDRVLELTYASRFELVDELSRLYGQAYGSATEASTILTGCTRDNKNGMFNNTSLHCEIYDPNDPFVEFIIVKSTIDNEPPEYFITGKEADPIFYEIMAELKGPIGPHGDSGHQGKWGMKGPKGMRGDKGYDGQPGEAGENGIKGRTGYKGIWGPPGPFGKPGIPGQPGRLFKLDAEN